MKKTLCIVGTIIGLVALVGSLSAFAWLYQRVRVYEQTTGARILSPAPAKKPALVVPAAAAEPTVRDETQSQSRPPAEQPPADLPPAVRFAVNGRYLPPCGDRSISIESVNMQSVKAEIRRVEPQNVVQLLAREEMRYRHYFNWGGADSAATRELAGEPTVLTNVCACVHNEKETWRFPVAVQDGRSANGVYLVSISNDVHRLVCVSDLGVSVRYCEEAEKLMVWVTSFTTGRPVADATVEVYSPANVLVMRGCTGINGLCLPARLAPGKPFAVIVRSATGDDMTFLALSARMSVDEVFPEGSRDEYLKPEESEAFLWTERGIYRHDEPIFAHLILRNGRGAAPKPFPVLLQLVDPRGGVAFEQTLIPDERGAVACEQFSVPADRPSGSWLLRAKTPGKNGVILGEREVQIEEFAPPQIRVAVSPGAATAHPTNFGFTVSAEHLFGGPADALACEGVITFEDAAFAPPGWNGYWFGDEGRGLKPNFHRLKAQVLDADGRTHFSAAMPSADGLPRALVKATAQGVVFEDGGRPATARKSAFLHFYPYYIGSPMPGWLGLPLEGSPRVRLACVKPDGSRLGEARRLVMRLERIDSVYSYRRNASGWNSWDCTRIRVPVVEDRQLETLPDADTEIALPIVKTGDYALTVTDQETGVSFGRTFYLGAGDDAEIRAPLANPTEVTLTADKSLYRVGDVPRLAIKSPFTGVALFTVLRETIRETRVLELTNATTEVVLPPVTRADAPNLDVFISVVQSVGENANHLAARAHGQTTLVVRAVEDEIPVRLDATVRIRPAGGSSVAVTIAAETDEDAEAVVTVVDEGINLLTDEKTPDPIRWFGRVRATMRPLYDLYNYVLPVDGDSQRARGAKTGGGFGADLLGRMSPVGSRRYQPLAHWKTAVPIVKGRGEATIDLPEFAGEVRVTAVVYTRHSTGAASVQRKVAPALVMQPDAPRFVAPGDTFGCSIPLFNRSGREGPVDYRVSSAGAVLVKGTVGLADGASTNVTCLAAAPTAVGELALVFEATGLGESHTATINLPVRPAVAWQEACGVSPASEWKEPKSGRWTARTFDSPLGNYESALRFLADYPHGCLEQTVSRILPLIAAGGILNEVVSNGTEFAVAAVRRVESMWRGTNFVMWPDCSTPPWDTEVSLYAAHFLVEAKAAGLPVDKLVISQIAECLYYRWEDSDNAEIATYATWLLARVNRPDRSRMLTLYDERTKHSALARARLALGFAELHDRERALALLKDSFEPTSIREAAFVVLALLEVNPDDSRILPLITWLDAQRDRARLSWGTTGENAHALLALGAYYRHHPPKRGEKFVAWRTLTLPEVKDVRDEAKGITVARRLLTTDGQEADLAHLTCGELLVAELTITSPIDRTLGDLVIEDLLPGGFDPVHRELDPSFALPPAMRPRVGNWVMRCDRRDDRVLVFSKRFDLPANHEAVFAYPVRVVTPGTYVLPGPSVEAMYFPELHARRAPSRVTISR